MELNKDNVTEDILFLEKQIIDPKVSRETLETIISDRFTEFGSSGKVYTKTGVIEALSMMPESLTEIIDFKISFITEYVVLATYSTIRSLSDNKSKALRSSIWVFENNKWQIIFHQGTVCKE